MVVQSVKFEHTNIIGDAHTAIEFFSKWDSDEIILLDVSRQIGDRSTFLKVVEEASEKCFVPLAVGGWIRVREDAGALFRSGADKVVLNTSAVESPVLISQLAEAYGSQSVVVSIDAKRSVRGKYEVFIDRGRRNTGVDVCTWAKQVEARGAGEILIKAMDQDGIGKGYDLQLIESVVDVTTIPVIASGGGREWGHFVDAIKLGGAHAVAASNVFHYTDQSVRKVKRYMSEHGLNVRV